MSLKSFNTQKEMAKPLYNIIAKVPCEECSSNIRMKRRIDTNCGSCKFVRYRNVGALDIVPFLNAKFPSWTWVNVFENIDGKKGNKIANFVRGKNEPVGTVITNNLK